PWITGAYYGVDNSDSFDDGWLRTGDVGYIKPEGFLQLTDRAKDVIKSGGEWSSSVEVENHLLEHPAVAEVAVIGVPDPKWDERPLATIVIKEGEPPRRAPGPATRRQWSGPTTPVATSPRRPRL